ncbi:2-oxoglutarate and iron-dependent oxygenase JMJD4 homolog isoform X2 [Leptidea sinapis]|uniref:2-oxoglutarate and iron-dependent oxygenase JMJD4 homolog isoform X2 n=1 Tax=Leptidea sinapis TaxID=189913 RepID=UPI0021C4B003|nr:2-oxoglutarate and iron-dependent oxygenase JMJD4 homolog isoform X2 [Leptidea sinapis]
MITNNLEIDIIIPKVRTPWYNEEKNCTLPLVFQADINYKEFFESSMLGNVPCVIKSISKEWEASKEWVCDDKINYKYFVDVYGEFKAPVADCNKINFNSQCKSEMTIKDYMEYLQSSNEENILYLKDWHLKANLKALKRSCSFYEVPNVFASDWLNEYAEDKTEDDFQFVYIGCKNTCWSVNVVGKKKWVFLPPGEENKLKDSFGNLPLLFDQLKWNNIKYFEVIQEKGDGIFVPSGWHHQVFNLCETISINHNFMNACNLHIVWQALQSTLTEVEKEIKEFESTPEYTTQCQVILKSLFGMDFQSFINLIMHIAIKRIKQIQGENFYLFKKFIFGMNHIKFDLQSILKVIYLIEDHPIFVNKNLPRSLILQLLNTKENILQVVQ